jgi:hypothetical protein
MTAAQRALRSGVINANTSSGGRVTPTCVVPGAADYKLRRCPARVVGGLADDVV